MRNSPPAKILLVEDNRRDLELTIRALEQAGVHGRIEIARDGAEALNFLFGPGPSPGAPPDVLPMVILLDLKLPKVDGLEVLARLKADPRTAPVPVVVLTSSAEQRDVVESYQLGLNSYIVKPVNAEQFTEVVRQLGLYWLLLNQTPQTHG